MQEQTRQSKPRGPKRLSYGAVKKEEFGIEGELKEKRRKKKKKEEKKETEKKKQKKKIEVIAS